MTRPVVTGIGVFAPTGSDTAEHWQTTLAGKSGLARISRFDPSGYATQVAGEVRGFDPSSHLPARLVRETDLMTQLALAATTEAMRDAAFPDDIADLDLAVVTANSSGGVEFGQRELQKLYAEGPHAVGAYMSIAWFYAATTGQMSIRHGMRGACGVMVGEQAGGLDALGQTRRVLRKGTRMVLSGGTDASLSPYGLVCQLSTGLLSPVPEPDAAFVPFDASAAGYVPGEGGAILVVEDAAHAAARGVRPYGEVSGYAATFDPRPGSGRPPGLRRAAALALADAGLRPSDVDVVFADGWGVPSKDREEAAALRALFGPYGVPVTVPKTMTGRLYAGGAALDVATALLALRDGVIPPTVNVADPVAGDDLDLVRDEPRPAPLRTALVLARGYGGFNAAVVLTAST